MDRDTLEQLGILLTMGGGFVAMEWRASRARRYLVEDREEERRDAAAERRAELDEIVLRAEAEAQALRIRAEASAARTREDARKSAEHIAEKIHEVKTVAESAFSEANHANTKIAALNAHLLVQGETIEAGRSASKIDAIKAAVDDIHVAVVPGAS